MSDSKDKENENENEIFRKNCVKNGFQYEIKNEIKDENDKKEPKNAIEEESPIKNENNIEKNNENNIKDESLNNNNKNENDIKNDDENKENNIINNINDDNKEKIIDNKDDNNNNTNEQVNNHIDDKKENDIENNNKEKNDKIDEENNINNKDNKENSINNEINENENKNEGDHNEKIDEKIENNENINKENKDENKDKDENNINNKDENKEENILNENEKNNLENKDKDKYEIINSNNINNDNILINDNNIDNIIDNNINIINVVHNGKNSNNNINNKKETKYILNFSLLIKQMQKDSDDVPKRNEIEFINNILLLSSDINEANKISCYTLLSYINYEKKKEAYIYYLYNKIFNKTFKDLEIQKNIEPFYFIRNLYRTAYVLEKEKNYFYVYECIKNIYDLKKRTHLDKKSTELLNSLIKRTKKGISDYINKSVKLFKNLEKENDTNTNKFDKLQKLIKDISDNSYQINDNNDDDNNNNNENNDEYLYLINKNWFTKLINFMEDFKSIKDNNQNKNKFKEYFKIVFNSINILNYYLNEDIEKDKYYAFPGPVDNFSIIDWKDTLDDPLNVDENIFLISDFKDYYLLKKSDFELLKDIFGVTNIIKRKKDNSEFIQIKTIIFDKRFKDKKNNKLLKKRTLQIKKTATVSEFKEKIVRCMKNLFNKDNNNEENNAINNLDNKKYNIYFFILDKENKNILIEMCISFVNNIPSFDCLYLKNIQISDEENISKLFSFSNEKKNILITEIQAENDPLFLKEISNDKYICTQCKKEINSEEDIYKCKICHMSLFCSDKCSKEGKDHDLLDKILKEKFFVEEFNLNKLFSEEFQSLFIEDNKSVKGKIGLKNNGNTCYMNSSLQCLSNTNDLTKYFLKKLYENDINFTNKLGTHGSISSIYYDFIKKMWYGHEKIISPIEFLKKFKNNFEENKQHDAQEFLNVLLDKLHEDLNHIKYQYNKDFPEEYKKIKEEKSIIKDLFDGLFKSEIICEECKASSINFESFRFLSLPIIRSKIQYSFKIFYDTKLIYFNIEYNPNYILKEVKTLAIEFLKTKVKEVNDLEFVIFNEKKMIEIIEEAEEKKIKSIYNGKREIAFYHKKGSNKEDYKYFFYPLEESKKEKNEKKKYCILSYPILFEVGKKETFKDFQTKIINRLKEVNFIDNKNDKNIILNFQILVGKNKCYFCKKEETHFCEINVQTYKIIKDVYDKLGFLTEKLGCLYCMSESFNKENPSYLNDDLGKEDEYPYFFSKHVSLKYLIHLFTNNDNLEGDNKWNCPKSKTHLKSKRKLQIYKAPNYLIIQLKRFRTEGYYNSFNGEKNNMFVSYPINNLDISNYIVGQDKNNAKYDLYGVIEHTGTLNSGHYKAICKNDDKWILYNDSTFEDINNPVTENAYILFYKRQNLDIIDD